MILSRQSSIEDSSLLVSYLPLPCDPSTTILWAYGILRTSQIESSALGLLSNAPDEQRRCLQIL
jgi:hypothetical protein